MAQKGKRIRYNQETRNDFQKALRKIKKKSYEGINEKGKSGDTILHQAAEIANQKTVREKGADVNAKNEREETPLYRAACMRHTKNVKVLITEAFVQLLRLEPKLTDRNKRNERWNKKEGKSSEAPFRYI
ncbi:ankyrin repeat domain-containing protein [Wolbachia endosymbiont of Pentalonia nigronervosa]|uniref:ankyrin repeat domain-containing protein n=1 Tax=Wolbachia endosymbiont of Pentalonia nigronervosa TaxID=1301914 RepID=UPI00165F5C62|nr:ankyrin repeat domain-containing protein [Wolbachia endosymbiont of Pentalonia nigronervosa]MBD0392059.1 ankyrin repeat domain-containing protein [Wolbachia endosymbiont of Pentalonia nigronervosa]